MPDDRSPVAQFFESQCFAVVGASASPHKYGHKVFTWYLSHSLPVTGVNPRTPRIHSHPTIASVRGLQDPGQTSVSFVTPPEATREVVREAAEVGVRAVWFQPGTWDRECLELARAAGMVVVGGEGGKFEEGGRCVLVHGEGGLRELGLLQ